MGRMIAAIDYGTSKIACVSARVRGSGIYDVLGFGSVPYAGYSDGYWNEANGLADATVSVIREAGIVGGKKIKKLYIGVPGDYSSVMTRRVTLDITSPDRRVRKSDTADILRGMPGPEKNSRYTLLHKKPLYYTLDNNERAFDPVGERTSRVIGRMCSILGEKRFMEQTHSLMEYIGVDVKGYVSTMLGEAAYMIPPAEKQIGCVLIDTGFSSTTVSILLGEGILFQKTIQKGAKEIITEMMESMNVNYTEADAVKRRYVFGLDNDSSRMSLMKIIDRTDKVRKYEVKEVADIIEGVTEDMLREINSMIEGSGFRLAKRSTVYITGGGIAMMNGIRQFASSIFARNVQVLTPQSPRINNAAYSGVLGVVDYICRQNGTLQGENL